MSSDILSITEKLQIDGSIQEYEFHSYEPIAGTNVNNPGEILLNFFCFFGDGNWRQAEA